jgi:hypothetical protein
MREIVSIQCGQAGKWLLGEKILWMWLANPFFYRVCDEEV